MTTETKTADKTCLITLVTPGRSDCVIKVKPAEMDGEKIWLNTRPGRERWEVIKRQIQQTARRDKPLMKPVPYCADGKKLAQVTLKEADIPVIELEGSVLKAKPREMQAHEVPMPMSPTLENAKLRADALDSRMGKLESQIDKMAQLVAAMAEKSVPVKAQGEAPVNPVHVDAQAAPVRQEQPKRGRGRPRKQNKEV